MQGTGRRVLLLAALSLGAAACEDEALDSDPARVVKELVARLGRAHGDAAASRAAYELLDREAQQNLAERAKRASALTGRNVAPEEMIAPSRFVPQFVPRRYEARVDGDRATVAILGSDPNQRREVTCHLDGQRWRAIIELPPLPPIQARPDSPRRDEAR